MRVDGFSWFLVDLFLVFHIYCPARGRTPVTGALSQDSTLYIYRKVRGRNFPSRGDFFGIIFVFTMYGVTKAVTAVTHTDLTPKTRRNAEFKKRRREFNHGWTRIHMRKRCPIN